MKRDRSSSLRKGRSHVRLVPLLACLLLWMNLHAAITPDVLMPPNSLHAALLPPLPDAGEHPFRRADVIFFIALPFTVLFTTLIQTALGWAVGLRASALWGTTPASSDIRFDNLYVRSDVLFVALNSVLWSGSIAVNDYFEGRDPMAGEKLRRAMDANRIDLTLLRLAF